MKSISTHILDIARGKPARGVLVRLDYLSEGEYKFAAEGMTDADGRVRDWKFEMHKGTWRIRFEVGAYFENLKEAYFYPFVEIVFFVDNPDQHYHVPLLLSPYGYSTYRGS